MVSREFCCCHLFLAFHHSNAECTLLPFKRIEKYRPKNLESVIFQDEIVSVLRSTLNGSDFPNLLVSRKKLSSLLNLSN